MTAPATTRTTDERTTELPAAFAPAPHGRRRTAAGLVAVGSVLIAGVALVVAGHGQGDAADGAGSAEGRTTTAPAPAIVPVTAAPTTAVPVTLPDPVAPTTVAQPLPEPPAPQPPAPVPPTGPEQEGTPEPQPEPGGLHDDVPVDGLATEPEPDPEPHPCDTIPATGQSLLVLHDPVVLAPGELTGSVQVHNCSDGDIAWTARTVLWADLGATSGTLLPGEAAAVPFSVDGGPLGPFTFKVKVSEPGHHHYVDITGERTLAVVGPGGLTS